MPRDAVYTLMDSPLGPLLLACSAYGLTHVVFQHGAQPLAPPPAWREDATALAPVRRQLQEYFASQRQHFTLPLAPVGTAFQLRVWQELQRIPFGTTISYRELAQRLGKPQAIRAVGHANGRNPLAIIIPCHRVIGHDGSLRGYAGGVAIKHWLLRHEGVQLV